MNHKLVKEHADALRRLGIDVTGASRTGSGHTRLALRRGERQATLVISSTASDRRSFLNAVQTAKRLFQREAS